MHYSHLYIEKDAEHYALTQSLKKNFSQAKVISIENYKHIFNRPRQNFMLQRLSPKLILAKQRHSFLEEGDARVQSFGTTRVFSCSIIRNCMYHCDYCFLQGMHQSSNIVVYVNIDDFQKHIEQLSQAHREESIYLIASYLTDLPAFEEDIPACKLFIDMVCNTPNITLEIRTKSDGFRHLFHLNPPKNAVMVFSLSPQEIIRTYEHGTASLHTRILQARQAYEKGWRVRLCFDPIIYFENWQHSYKHCVQEVFRRINPQAVEMLSYGVFRMGKSFLSPMQAQRPHIPVLHHNIYTRNGLGTYSDAVIDEIRTQFFDMLLPFMPQERIHFVHG